MANQYLQPLHENTCLGVSFANLLLDLGEEILAVQVLNKYHEHRLVSENGAYLQHAPQIVRDLTGYKYDAVIYASLEYYKRLCDENEVFGDLVYGKIRSLRDKLDTTTPFILVTRYDLRNDQEDHAFFVNTQGTIINNGKILGPCPDGLEVKACIKIHPKV